MRKLLALVKPAKSVSQMSEAERRALADHLFDRAKINAPAAREGQDR